MEGKVGFEQNHTGVSRSLEVEEPLYFISRWPFDRRYVDQTSCSGWTCLLRLFCCKQGHDVPCARRRSCLWCITVLCWARSIFHWKSEHDYSSSDRVLVWGVSRLGWPSFVSALPDYGKSLLPPYLFQIVERVCASRGTCLLSFCFWLRFITIFPCTCLHTLQSVDGSHNRLLARNKRQPNWCVEPPLVFKYYCS